jgi:WD repeat-containing protein 19
VVLKTPEAWQQLAVAALEQLDVELAVAAYRQLGNASMVLSLERLQQHEDRNLLSAHILVLLERDYNAAQVPPCLQTSIPQLHVEARLIFDGDR